MANEDGYQIDNCLLQESIAQEVGCFKEDVSIEKFTLAAGSNKGDNFTCVLKAVDVDAKVKGEARNFKYMIKCVPVSEYRAHILEELHAFEKEVFVYNELIPAYQNILKDHGMKELSVPKCFHANVDKGIVVMENLKENGYSMVQLIKNEELTLEHVKLILAEAALYHAVGYKYLDEYKGKQDQFLKDNPQMAKHCWRSDNEFVHKMFPQTTSMALTTLKHVASAQEQDLVEWLEKYGQQNKHLVDRAVNPKGNFNVLLHGDLHGQNVMFSYDKNGSPKTVKLLDLQIMAYARPTADVAYFIGGSVNNVALDEDELVQIYHKCLIDCMTQLGYPKDIYPNEQMVADFDDCYGLAIFMKLMVGQFFAASQTEREESFDVDQMVDEKAHEEMMVKMADAVMNNEQPNPIYVELVKALARCGMKRIKL